MDFVQVNRRRHNKQNEHVLHVLANVPWWVSIIVAMVCFVALRWVLPAILGPNLLGKVFGTISVSMAPWVSLIFVGVAVVAAVREFASHLAQSRRIDSASRRINDDFGDSAAGPVELRPVSIKTELATAPAPLCWSLTLLRELEWKRFEEVSAELLRLLGFRAEMLAQGPDGDIDIKLFTVDGTKPSAIVQCKSWITCQVGIKPLRELLGVMAHEKVSEGIFLATGSFTNEATEFAKANRIDAVNGQRYLEMIQTLSEVAQRQLLQTATKGDYRTPSCPSCGTKLVRRTAARGEFWGCSTFPRCRYTLNSSSND